MNQDQNSPYEYEEPVEARPSKAKPVALIAAGFLVFGGLIGGGAYAASQVNQPTADLTPTSSAAAQPAPEESTDASQLPSPSASQVSVAPITFGDEDDNGDGRDHSEDSDESEGEHHGDHDSHGGKDHESSKDDKSSDGTSEN